MVTFSLERVFFFDIDNCLYPPDRGIDRLMKERIYEYGCKAGISKDTVIGTCERYYADYGLSIRGLLMHHGIDPVKFDAEVDGSLPIEQLIKPDPQLRAMLERVSIRRWAFTNAGYNHAQRVLRCLKVEDLFEGITYCNYAEPDFPCKPERPAYERAMKEAGAGDASLCYFVDDNPSNVAAARSFGWTAVLAQPSVDGVCAEDGRQQVQTVHQLPLALPRLFGRERPAA
ncbi:suppressor of deletion of TFIIS [Coemansia sp. RSA 552]|nr:suppressor of deletion of TFIIS [Coemansia sp. RSA 552]